MQGNVKCGLNVIWLFSVCLVFSASRHCINTAYFQAIESMVRMQPASLLGARLCHPLCLLFGGKGNAHANWPCAWSYLCQHANWSVHGAQQLTKAANLLQPQNMGGHEERERETDRERKRRGEKGREGGKALYMSVLSKVPPLWSGEYMPSIYYPRKQAMKIQTE